MVLALAPATRAEELKVAVGQRGNWDTVRVGAGPARRHLQEIRAGTGRCSTPRAAARHSRRCCRASVDIGVAAGTLGARWVQPPRARPVRIIGGGDHGRGRPVSGTSRHRLSAQDGAGLGGAHRRLLHHDGSSTDTVVPDGRRRRDHVAFKTVRDRRPAGHLHPGHVRGRSTWAGRPRRSAWRSLAAGKIRTRVPRQRHDLRRSDQTIRVLITHAAVSGAEEGRRSNATCRPIARRWTGCTAAPTRSASSCRLRRRDTGRWHSRHATSSSPRLR